MTRQGVDERRRRGRLLGLSAGRKGYLYPVWQFDPEGEGRVLAGLESVLDALEDVDDWMKLTFFLGPQSRLADRSPLEYLRQVRELVTEAEQRQAISAVVRVARAYGEQGGN